jgi:hypothetical protein
MGKESRTKLVAVEPTKSPLDIALPTQIDASELAYQTHLIQKIRSEQQAHQHQLQTWSAYLSQRYQLTPKDQIREDGQIVRVAEKETA